MRLAERLAEVDEMDLCTPHLGVDAALADELELPTGIFGAHYARGLQRSVQRQGAPEGCAQRCEEGREDCALGLPLPLPFGLPFPFTGGDGQFLAMCLRVPHLRHSLLSTK